MRFIIHTSILLLLIGVSGRFSAQFGVLDDTFGSGGVVISSLGELDDISHEIVQQSDGKILIGGSSGQDFALLRFLLDGTPDINFGNLGVVITDYKGSYDEGLALALQEDGKILIAGLISSGISSLLRKKVTAGEIFETYQR